MSEKHTFKLLSERRFLPLFCTQFLGAFNDSLYKNALIVLIAFSTKPLPTSRDTLTNLCAILFIFPFFIFSALAGQLADKHEKAILIRWIKGVEVILAMLAFLGFYLNNLWLLLGALFLLGIQATFFGPVKYSILPQHLKESELLGGNGLIEMGTFIAILLGTLSGAILIALPKGGLVWVSSCLFVIAILGLITSFFIPNAKAYVPSLKVHFEPFSQTAKILISSFQNKIVFHSIIGISWFWVYGSLVLTQIAHYTQLILGGNEKVVTVLLFTFSIGIGFGSVFCNRLSRKKLDVGVVLFGAIGLSVFAFDLGFAHGPIHQHTLGALEFLQDWHSWRILLDAFLMGTFGGFYVVPLYTLIQTKSEPEVRSRMIAANNVLNSLFMVLGSALAIVFLNAGFTIPQLFLLIAVLNTAMAFYLIYFIPNFWSSFVAWVKKSDHYNKQ